MLGFTKRRVTMHVPPPLHESCDLKQARPYGQYVDLLHRVPATPSQALIIPRKTLTVNLKITFDSENLKNQPPQVGNPTGDGYRYSLL